MKNILQEFYKFETPKYVRTRKKYRYIGCKTEEYRGKQRKTFRFSTILILLISFLRIL